MCPAGRIDLPCRDADGAECSHEEHRLLTTSTVGGAEGGFRAECSGTGRAVGDMLVAPMVHLQDGFLHGELAHAVAQFLIIGGTEMIHVLIADARRQYEIDNTLGFHDNWEKLNANEAFIIHEDDPVKISIWPDVDRDGEIDVADVTAIIAIILVQGNDSETESLKKIYDYDVADVDRDGAIDVADVTALIDIILKQ